MPTLSSSIVKASIASLREVEDALARQTMYGGDLATNLLELAQVEEVELVKLLAANYGLEPAGERELATAPDEVVALLPADIAVRYGIYPLAEQSGVLTVAVAEPLAPEVEDDLGFALGLQLEQRLSPLVRIRQAIARDYGWELDRRMERLVARLEGRPDPRPSEAPHAMGDFNSLPRPPTVPPIARPPATELGTIPPPQPDEPTQPAATRRSAPPDHPPTSDRTTPDEPSTSVAETADDPPSSAGQAPDEQTQAVRSGATQELPAQDVSGSGLAADPARRRRSSQTMAAVEPAPRSTASVGYSRDLAEWARSARKHEAKHARRSRRRGPYTAAMAERDLLAATTHTAVLEAFFDFALQYFEYSALFAIQSDIAEGRDAHGNGAPRSRVRGIGVPLDLPSSLSRVRDTGHHSLLPLKSEGIDLNLAKDLARPVGGDVLLLPVLLKKRCVIILYGDEGRANVRLDEVGDVIAFAPLVSTALERLIRLRKSGSDGPASTAFPAHQRRHAPPPGKHERASALADALSTRRGSTQAPKAAEPVGGNVRNSAKPSQFEPVEADSTTSAGGTPSSEGVVPGTQRATPAAKRRSDPPPSAEPEPQKKFVTQRATPEAKAELEAALKRLERKPADKPKPPSEAGSSDKSPAPERPRKPGSVRPSKTISVGVTAGAPTDARSEQEPPQQPIPLSTRKSKPVKRATPTHGTPGLTTASHSEPPEPIPLTRRSNPRNLSPAGREVDASVWDAEEHSTTPGMGAPERAPKVPSDIVPETLLDDDADSAPEISLDAQDAGWTDLTADELAEIESLEQNEDGDDEDDDDNPMAAASRSMRVPPTRPRQATKSVEMRLPKVIVDLKDDIRDLIDALLKGDESAMEQLVEMGADAASALAAEFPGPIERELRSGVGEAPAKASECGPVLRTLARIGPSAVPFLAVRTNDRSPDIRAWATRLLGELPSIEGAKAVVRRLVDGNAEVRRAALAAGRMMQSHDDARTALRDGLSAIAEEDTQSEDTRHAALESLSDLRDPRAVHRLMPLLEQDNEDVVKSAHWALCTLTRQDFGLDRQQWSKWWEANRDRHRIEWLIDALMHEDADVRRSAGDELKMLTKEYFGYYDDLPKKERNRAQQRYREWWDSRGKARFRD